MILIVIGQKKSKTNIIIARNMRKPLPLNLRHFLANNIRITSLIVLFAIPIIVECCPLPNKIYVDSCAMGIGDGTSWANAFTDLSTALDAARTCGAIDTICVAQGTYVPTDSLGNIPINPRNVSFTLPDSVIMLGGFAPKLGIESVDDRNPELYKTILSGDLLKNDSSSYSNLYELDNRPSRADNALHIIDQSNVALSNQTVIDGFCITGGNADGSNYYNGYGSGMYLLSSDVAIRNCVFLYNSAHEKGGAVLVDTFSNVVFDNCLFRNNFTDDDGGAVVNEGSASFSHCYFDTNITDDDGGAVNNREYTSASFTNCTFVYNEAYDKGGAVYSRDSSDIQFVTCVFESNYSYFVGGALYFRENTQGQILSSRFDSNYAYHSGGAIANGIDDFGDLFFGGTLQIDSSSFTNNFCDEIGGAISNFIGTVEIFYCQFDENIAGTAGGAIVSDDATLLVEQSSFTKDSSAFGGAIANAVFYDIPVIRPFTTSIVDCTFEENWAAEVGGALFVREIESTIDRTSFRGNEAVFEGGALFSDLGSLEIKNSLFSGNYASDWGGAVSAIDCGCAGLFDSPVDAPSKSNSSKRSHHYSKGSYRREKLSLPYNKALIPGELVFTNNTFTGNHAEFEFGGALSFLGINGSFTNNIIWNNRDNSGAGSLSSSIDNDGTTLSFSHSIVQGSGGSSAWDMSLGSDQGGNLDADPLFTTILDPTNAPSTSGNFSLQCMSPAIDSGTSDTTSLDLGLFDLIKDRRLASINIDLGALEKPEVCQEIDVHHEGIFLVSGDASPSAIDGTSFGEGCSMIMDTFFIKNSGQQVIIVDTITILPLNDNQGAFSYNQASFLFPDTIESGDSIPFKISFLPTECGIDSAQVTIENNDADENPFLFVISAVKDTTAPTPNCIDTIIYLSESGMFTIDSSYVENGSSDNCEIESISLDKYTFTCSDIGDVSVLVTVEDMCENMATCTSVITVMDTVSPIALCRDTAIYLNSTGMVEIDSSFVDNSSTDNCDIASMSLSMSSFSCSNIGENSVMMTITDVNGNFSSCSSIVTVLDTISPSSICQDTTIYLDLNGQMTIDSTYINNGSFDNCELASISLSQYSFDCDDLGDNTILLTTTDVNGNSSSCSATVTVRDTLVPVALCHDTTVYLDENGFVMIDSSFVDAGSFDNCAIQTGSLDSTSFGCDDIGSNNVTLTITDIRGNQDTCTSLVTVLDTISPTAICNDFMVRLSSDGIASIDIVDINNGSFDNCSIDTIYLDKTTFDCDDIGDNTVILTTVDVNGNDRSCSANVIVEPFVLDAPPSISGPEILCQNLNGISYTLPDIPESNNFQWSYSGTGLTIHNNGDPDIVIDFGIFTSGTLEVELISSSCGNVIGIAQLELNVGDSEFCDLSNCDRGEIFVDSPLLDQAGSLDVYQVNSLIESDAIIRTNRVITFKSGVNIEMYPDFVVEQNGIFTAEIEPCLQVKNE